MYKRQDKFRDWLKSQPPEEILHHTYEYTVREDIVMAMEELELTDAQAQALLESPSPLADVYLSLIHISSPEQQEVLSRYVGWGGLSDAFDPEKPAWASECAQLKELSLIHI